MFAAQILFMKRCGNTLSMSEAGSHPYKRYYNSDLSIWLSVDPMSDKYPGVSPYAYCGNNPVRLVDPNGRDVIITGEAAKDFFRQVKIGAKAYGISVKMDKDGKLSAKYKGKGEISEDGAKLMNAITDQTVKVTINAIYHKEGTFTDFMFGGTFGGNEIAGEVIDGRFIGQMAWANQTVIPDELKTMDRFYGKLGRTSLHEITEAYGGARIAMECGYSSIGTGRNSYAFIPAHNGAIPQSGPVNRFFYDVNDRPTQNPESARYIDWNLGWGTPREKNVKTTDLYKTKQ